MKTFKPEDFLKILIEPDPEQTFDELDYTKRKHRKKGEKEKPKKVCADKIFDIGV